MNDSENEFSDLDTIIALLKNAEQTLRTAENKVVLAENQYAKFAPTQEAQSLENWLHEATHEIASTLAFYIHDIERMRAALQIRAAFSQYSNETFTRIVQSAWSLKLVAELHKDLPHISLKDHSTAVRAICGAYAALPTCCHS